MREAIVLLLTLLLGLSLFTGCTARTGSDEPAASASAPGPEESAPDRSAGGSAETSAQTGEASASEPVTAEGPASPDWVQKLPQAQEAEQLFVVAATDLNTAQVSLHQRDGAGTWRELLHTTGWIGKNGLGKEREGDGKTPVGTFRFNRAFGIAEDPGCAAFEYVQVNGNHYWSGDQREGMHYNELVDLRELPDLDTAVSEHIEDFWDQYQYCLNISWNEDGTPGKGSAIFLHCKGGSPYTGGCVALEREQMEQVLRQVSPACVVVIDSLENLGGA